MGFPIFLRSTFASKKKGTDIKRISKTLLAPLNLERL